MRFLSYIATNICATFGAIAGVLVLAAVMGLSPGCKKEINIPGTPLVPMVPKSELTSSQKHLSYANSQLKAAGIGQRKTLKLHGACKNLLDRCQVTLKAVAPAEAPSDPPTPQAGVWPSKW